MYTQSKKTLSGPKAKSWRPQSTLGELFLQLNYSSTTQVRAIRCWHHDKNETVKSFLQRMLMNKLIGKITNPSVLYGHKLFAFGLDNVFWIECRKCWWVWKSSPFCRLSVAFLVLQTWLQEAGYFRWCATWSPSNWPLHRDHRSWYM